MVQKQNVGFTAKDDVILRGWLFVPEGPSPHPAITMAHGFGCEGARAERFAQVFAAARFVVLVHDHRGFGGSGGSPRYDIDRGCRSPTGAGRSPSWRANPS
jgi:alpha-beta hydrolase superfamily lysophospholipase